MKVEVICDFFSDSGYGVHSRNLVNALFNEGIEIAISTNRPANWSMNVSDNELKMLNTSPEGATHLLLITMPSTTPFYLSSNKKILQYVVWEGDRIPKAWLPVLFNNKVEHILVPSQHTKDAIINTLKNSESWTDANEYGTTRETTIDMFYGRNIDDIIRIVPHGVDSSLFYPKPELKDNTYFTFLADKGWPHGSKDRGGISFLVKAFLEEFTKEEKVKLLLKINAAYGMTPELLNNNFTELKVQNKNLPRIDIIPQNVPYNKLIDLYNQAHVFVIPSLAESFHIGGLQAMACSLPIIATDFGGQTDYVNEENGWLLKEGNMIKVDWDVLYEGVSWKKPNIGEIRRALRDVYEKRNTELITKGVNAYRDSKDFSWKNSALKIKALIN